MKMLFLLPKILFFLAGATCFAQEVTPASPSYKKKDIEFENRVVENAKRTPLDTSYNLNSVKGQPDLHKKRTTYSMEIEQGLSGGLGK